MGKSRLFRTQRPAELEGAALLVVLAGNNYLHYFFLGGGSL